MAERVQAICGNTGSDAVVMSKLYCPALCVLLTACVSASAPAWSDIEPIIKPLAYGQVNAQFCGDPPVDRADDVIRQLSGPAKQQANDALAAIEAEFEFAEAEYVCTVERYFLFEDQAIEAQARWDALKTQQGNK